jgi:hypothetical protein
VSLRPPRPRAASAHPTPKPVRVVMHLSVEEPAGNWTTEDPEQVGVNLLASNKSPTARDHVRTRGIAPPGGGPSTDNSLRRKWLPDSPPHTDRLAEFNDGRSSRCARNPRPETRSGAEPSTSLAPLT